MSSNATVQSIQSAIRAAEGGDTRQLFALYRDLTAGGSHIQAEFNKRKLALLAQPLSVLPATKQNQNDMAAAAAVTQMIADCENWTDGISHLLDSCLWPVAVVEKVFRKVEPGEPAALLGLRYTLKRLEIVNPALFCFRPPFGGSHNAGRVVAPKHASGQPQIAEDVWEPDLRFWSTDADGRILYDYDQTYGADPARHIVHRGHLLIGMRDCWGGPMRALVFWWLLGVLGRDWFARGMERYGTPFPVGHTDAKDKQALDFLQEAFSLSTKVGGLVVDHETQIELKEIAATGMADAHEKFINVCHREISKVVVGQTLSADAQPTGLGSSVGKLQSDVRQDIRMFDQIKLGDTARQQIFTQFLQINGLRGGAPKPVWGGLSDEDAKSLAELLDVLSRAGWEPTDEAVPTMNERLGFPVQRKAVPAPVLPGSQFGGGQGAGKPMKETKVLADGQEQEQQQDPETLRAALPPRLRGRIAALSAQNKMADVMGVPTSWLNPMRDFMEQLQEKAADKSISDQDLMDFLDQAVKRVPELFKEMDVDELAKVLEAGMGESVMGEVRRGLRKA